ncbi:hypothetical protein C8R45DRAFT_1104747 [Mycena sanguinolenta]|nr:hypothetical protein C8R45DRAFT_1104747 [Mycena sanguinolenta]
MSTKKIPEFYEKNAPWFDDDKPEELQQFLENVERMMEIEGTADKDKSAFIIRYTTHKMRELWKQFTMYSGPYQDFKKEILANYPSAIDNEHGSTRKFKKVLKKFDEDDIGAADQDELMKLSWEMLLEVSKLMKSNQLTDWEAVPLFLGKLEEQFREKILSNLEQSPPVMEEAKQIAKRQNVNTEFFEYNKDSSRTAGRSSSPGRSMATRVVKREEVDASTMLESIKLTVVNLMSELEDKNSKCFTRIEEMTQKQLAEMTAFYKSLPGVVSGAPDSQTLPPRQVCFRPLTQTDLCWYCNDTGHTQGNCPHRKGHIDSGALRVAGNKDYHADGRPLYAYGNKSKQQMVEEGRAKPAGNTAQANIQNVFLQTPGMYPIAPGDLQLDSEPLGTSHDSSEYDLRDDEIRTLIVEMANMKRLLATQAQHLQGWGVQPPLPLAPAPPPAPAPASSSSTFNSEFLATVLAQTISKLNTSDPFLAQTRSQPSRTGPPADSGKEGF